MLVYMKHSGAIQLAGKSMIGPKVCGVCKSAIPKGDYYTMHQAPDPRRIDPYTGRYRMVPYVACEACAPFVRLEPNTVELPLMDIMREAAKLRAAQEETQIQVPVVRTSTPRPTSAIQRSIKAVLRPTRLVKDESWLK